MESAARSSLRRGDADGAIARLRRAAELSPDRADRRRRLSQAAYAAAWVAGHLKVSHEIMREVEGNPAARSLSAAATAGFLVLVTEGDADTAHALLTEAVGQAPVMPGPPREELETALFTLTLASQYSGRPEHWQPLADVLARFPEAAPAAAASLGRVHHDLGSVTDGMLRRLDEEIARLRDQSDADVVIRTALTASYLDRLPGCREAVSQVIRDGGAVGSSMPALMFVALDDLYAGRWQASAGAADELVALSEETGYHLFAQVGHYIAAMTAAQRGALDACREHCEDIWGGRVPGACGGWRTAPTRRRPGRPWAPPTSRRRSGTPRRSAPRVCCRRSTPRPCGPRRTSSRPPCAPGGTRRRDGTRTRCATQVSVTSRRGSR